MIHTRDHEPPHVTVYRGTPENYEALARIEIGTGRLMSNKGFNQKTIELIQKVVSLNNRNFLEKWHETRPKTKF